jgi:UDP-N-acetylmuramoylalanine--D-glutamate ligase
MRSDNIFCVVGLGKSGYSAALLLKNKGFSVRVSESSDSRELKKRAKLLLKSGIDVELKGHKKSFYKDASLYVVSPSVSADNPIVKYAQSLYIPVISEIELAWMYSPTKVVAITGTNGKTSVSTYLYRVLKRLGYPVVLAGNIGIPFSSLVSDLKKDDIVILELSSFQLEHTVSFHPYIAVLLNISQDHLDRHKTIESYLDAKFKIFSNQNRDDIAVVDLSQDMIKNKKDLITAKLIDISSFNFNDTDIDQNQRAVYIIAKALGAGDKRLVSELKRLKRLPHRREDAGSIYGVRFINDSKATNPHATKWALNSIDSNIILIAGGRDKGIDFRIAKDEISKKVKALILIGESREKIASELGGFVEVVKFAQDLKEALDMSLKEALAGDTVLLSPMCSSFDMFKNYEERGNIFKKIVRDIRTERCRD